MVPGLGRFPGEGNGNPLQYSCLGNPMDRGAWWASVHGVTKSQTQLYDSTTTSTVLCRKTEKTLNHVLFPKPSYDLLAIA